MAHDNLHSKKGVAQFKNKLLEMYLKFVMQNVLVSYPGTISLKVKSNYVLKMPRVTYKMYVVVQNEIPLSFNPNYSWIMNN